MVTKSESLRRSTTIRQVLSGLQPPPELLRQILDATSDLPAVDPISGTLAFLSRKQGFNHFPQYQEQTLTEILTPTNLLPLFTNRPDLVPVLFPSITSGLPAPSAEALHGIIQ